MCQNEIKNSVLFKYLYNRMLILVNQSFYFLNFKLNFTIYITPLY